MKDRNSKLIITILTFLAMLWPVHIYANVPLPSLFGIIAPLYFYIVSFGSAFIAVMLIEAAVLAKVIQMPFRKGLKLAFIVNLASTVFGLLAGVGALFFVASMILAYLLYNELKKTWKFSKVKSSVLCIILIILVVSWALVTYPLGNAITAWAFWGSLVLAFVLTVIIETVIGRRVFDTPHLVRGMILANGASYLFLVVLIFAFNINPHNQPMVSTDYLYASAEEAARRGKPDQALYFIQRLRELKNADREGYDSFYVSRELIVAEELIRNGFYEDASRVIRQIEDTKVKEEKYLWTESNNQKMNFLKRRIEKHTPSFE